MLGGQFFSNGADPLGKVRVRRGSQLLHSIAAFCDGQPWPFDNPLQHCPRFGTLRKPVGQTFDIISAP